MTYTAVLLEIAFLAVSKPLFYVRDEKMTSPCFGEAPFQHMGEKLLEAPLCVDLETRLCKEFRPADQTQLTAPDQLPTEFGISAPPSILIPWQRFIMLL